MLKKIIIINSVLFNTLLHADTQTGLDVSGKYQQQNYVNGQSQIYRLALQPWVVYDAWMLYADIPFESYNNTSHSSQTIYTRSSTGRIIRRIQPQIINSTSTQRQQGISDTSLGVSYSLGKQNWQHNLALDYKLATGDASLGLGSDTNDTSLSFSSSYMLNKVQLQAQIGHVWLNTSATSSSKNYTFLSTGISWKKDARITLSLNYTNQSEPYTNAPQQAYVQSRVDWHLVDKLKLFCSYGEYLQQHISLPENEFSIGTTFLF